MNNKTKTDVTEITDLHVHTTISHDGSSPSEDYVKLAIKNQDKRIAFSEHYDYDSYLADKNYKLENLDFYASEIARLRDKYSDKIDILFGIEFGYGEGVEDHYSSLIEKYPFDYIINSTHTIDGVDCYADRHSKLMPKNVAYTKYLELLYKSLSAPYDWQIVGHIGYPSRYSSYEDKLLKYDEFSPILDAILIKIIEKQKYLEINSSTSSVLEFLPEKNIVQRYVELGGTKFTFGSDAHSTVRYKDKCETVANYLANSGFTPVAFKNRKPL